MFYPCVTSRMANQIAMLEVCARRGRFSLREQVRTRCHQILVVTGYLDLKVRMIRIVRLEERERLHPTSKCAGSSTILHTSIYAPVKAVHFKYLFVAAFTSNLKRKATIIDSAFIMTSLLSCFAIHLFPTAVWHVANRYLVTSTP